MTDAISAFKAYVNTFDLNNEKISGKIAHTYRVCEIARILSKDLGLNEKDSLLFEKIALLHDIGRFEQIKEQESFSDFKVDHATLGVNYLFKDKNISKYNQDEEENKIIYEAINYHNKHTLDIPFIDKRTNMFINLIRDADKIDIINLLSKRKGYIDFVGVPDSYFKDLENKKLVKICDIEATSSTQFMIVCGYMYDFNYKESLKLLKERQYLENYFNSLEVDEKVKVKFNKLVSNALEVLEGESKDVR